VSYVHVACQTVQLYAFLTAVFALQTIISVCVCACVCEPVKVSHFPRSLGLIGGRP